MVVKRGGLLSGFQRLNEYKNNILYKLITNDNLVKALICNDENFLDYDSSNFNPATLIYSQIFPYQYSFDINIEPQSFITMSFGNYSYVNNCFKSGIFSIYVITHNSLLKTSYGLRTDYILNEVDNMFNQTKEFGDFKSDLYSSGDIKVSDEYFGCMISYKFYDFQ